MRRVIIIVLAAVILLGGGVAVYFMFIAPETEAVEKPVVLYAYSTGDPFVVNIKDSNHHLKCNIVLKYSGDETKGTEELDKVKYDIRDKINDVLGSITEDNLLGEMGKQIVRRDVLARLKSELGLEIVQAILLVDFVIV